MKRLMPQILISWLATQPPRTKADLFTIALSTGSTIYATSGQMDIVVPSGTAGWTGSTTTFSSTLYGQWSRGPITSEGSFALSANTMDLTLVPQAGTLFPNLQIGILDAAMNGLFEMANVTVYTAYMPWGEYGNVSYGLETKFFGTLAQAKSIDRGTKAEFEVGDPMYWFNQKVPMRIIQANCPWSYGDVNCNPPGGKVTVTFTAKTGSTQTILTPNSAFSQATGYFSQGPVKCTIGANAGLSLNVKTHDSSGNLELDGSWLLPPAVGDTFVVTAGCDRTYPTCKSKFNNGNHFGGMIDVPPDVQAL